MFKEFSFSVVKRNRGNLDVFKQKLNVDRQIVYLDDWFVEFYVFEI